MIPGQFVFSFKKSVRFIWRKEGNRVQFRLNRWPYQEKKKNRSPIFSSTKIKRNTTTDRYIIRIAIQLVFYYYGILPNRIKCLINWNTFILAAKRIIKDAILQNNYWIREYIVGPLLLFTTSDMHFCMRNVQ